MLIWQAAVILCVPNQAAGCVSDCGACVWRLSSRALQRGTCSKVWASSSEAYKMTELAPPVGPTALGLPSGCVGQSEGSARNTCAAAGQAA